APISGDQTFVTLYPNPASSTVILQQSQRESGYITLVTPVGQTVLRRNLDASGNTSIGVESLPAGLYILEVRTASFHQAVSFVKL
ncbi:MAG TPA: T9SS type A sorting domain-containing protein, partial [Chitinophagales bacterium]|nr:T9SS type A sorting domain-containing protein [Chitinophagales bacterium]